MVSRQCSQVNIATGVPVSVQDVFRRASGRIASRH